MNGTFIYIQLQIILYTYPQMYMVTYSQIKLFHLDVVH